MLGSGSTTCGEAAFIVCMICECCYREKGTKTWHYQGKQQNKAYNQPIKPNQPSIGTIHRPSTRHHRQNSLRVKSRNTHQRINHAHHQHTKPWPARHKPCRFIAVGESSQPTQLSSRRSGTQASHCQGRQKHTKPRIATIRSNIRHHSQIKLWTPPQNGFKPQATPAMHLASRCSSGRSAC